MKESKDRTEQFMYSTASAANQAPSSSFFNTGRQAIS
jgi:syntaxin 5